MRKIVEIPVNKIKIIDIDFKEKSDDEIEWLKRYIQKRGYVLPMSVTKYKDKYILNNCFATFTAVKKLGYKTVPCRIISERERLERIALRIDIFVLASNEFRQLEIRMGKFPNPLYKNFERRK